MTSEEDLKGHFLTKYQQKHKILTTNHNFAKKEQKSMFEVGKDFRTKKKRRGGTTPLPPKKYNNHTNK